MSTGDILMPQFLSFSFIVELLTKFRYTFLFDIYVAKLETDVTSSLNCNYNS